MWTDDSRLKRPEAAGSVSKRNNALVSLMIALQPSAGPALVVGGGTVAARKVAALVEAGFAVTVVAPRIADAIAAHARVTVVSRRFEFEDLGPGAGYAVVFACTDAREVNRLVGELARAAGIPVNVCDEQSESTFFSPATLRQGDVAVAVSTGGASPLLAREIRGRVAAALGYELAQGAATARAERQQRLGRDGGSAN